MTSKSNKKTLTTKTDALDQGEAKRSPSRRASGSRRSSFKDTSPSLTQQQFKSSVDVNNIVRHYANTGIDPYESRKQRIRFGDATEKSFTDAMYQVAEVNSVFAKLPAVERQSFSNDPRRWLASLEAQAIAEAEIVPPEAAEAVSEEAPADDTALDPT